MRRIPVLFFLFAMSLHAGADTLKGYGVSYMAGDYKWHMGVPTEEEFAIAMRELGESEGGAA